MAEIGTISAIFLAPLHFDEKKCGEGSAEVRKASLGGGFGGLGKRKLYRWTGKKCFGGRGASGFERGKESGEGFGDFVLAFWEEERQSSRRGRNGFREERKEKISYGGEAQ